MMAIVCPLHHLLALMFYVVMPSKRLGLSVLSYRKSDRIDLSKSLELAFGDIQLTEELPYQVLRLEYFSTVPLNEVKTVVQMFYNNPSLFPRDGCGPTYVYLLSRPYWYLQFTSSSETYQPSLSFGDLQMTRYVWWELFVVFTVDKKAPNVKSNWAVWRPSLPTQNPTAKPRAYGWRPTFLPFNCRD